MDVIDAEYQCHKQNTSSQEKSCVNRASFVFMANFENFFLRFVMNSYIVFLFFLILDFVNYQTLKQTRCSKLKK